MLDALAGRQPLHVASAEACGRAQRIRMVDAALAHQSHGLEAAMGVAGKAGDLLAVVHGKSILGAEVAAHFAAFELHGLHAHLAVAGRVAVIVVSAEQERVQAGPAWAQGALSRIGWVVVMVISLWAIAIRKA